MHDALATIQQQAAARAAEIEQFFCHQHVPQEIRMYYSLMVLLTERSYQKYVNVIGYLQSIDPDEAAQGKLMMNFGSTLSAFELDAVESLNQYIFKKSK